MAIKKKYFTSERLAEAFAILKAGRVYTADFIGGYIVQYQEEE